MDVRWKNDVGVVVLGAIVSSGVLGGGGDGWVKGGKTEGLSHVLWNNRSTGFLGV